MSPTRWLAFAALALLPIALAKIPADPVPETGDGPESLFAETEPAANPTRLHLQIDRKRLLGWVSGTEDFSGKRAVITVSDKIFEVTIGTDNTFTWELPDAAEEVSKFRVRVGDMGSVIYSAPPEPDSRDCVFFVTDRTVYRPGLPLHFAAFLRKRNTDGGFEPLAGRAVKVEVGVDPAMDAKAATEILNLVSDENGKIVGSYDFTDADTRTVYKLRIRDFDGHARVRLAEFRKAKVMLAIDGEVSENALKVNFAAVDFHGDVIGGSQVHYTAQVTRASEFTEAGRALNPEEYVQPIYGLSGDELWRRLPEDVRLLWEAQGEPPVATVPLGERSVTEMEGRVPLKGTEPGEVALRLKPEWLDGRHRVTVHGVVIDANGQEQRASRSFPLGDQKSDWGVSLANDHVEPGREVGVTVKGAGNDAVSIVVTRLRADRAVVPLHGFGEDWGTDETVVRSILSVEPVASGEATFTLDEPGAYKLIAIRKRADGSRDRREVGLLVREAKAVGPLVLNLEREEIDAGQPLRGTVHCKYDGARVLMTVRDINGIVAWKVLRVDGGVRRFEWELPGGLSYGCSIDAAYLGDKGATHIDQEYFRVVPRDRMIEITAKMKPEVRPGEAVTIDLSVNRKEPVDLMVSVYDESLLTMEQFPQADPTNYFLANDRIRGRVSTEVMRRIVEDVTIHELVKRASEQLGDSPKDWDFRRSRLNEFVDRFRRLKRCYVSTENVAMLLQLVGLPATPDENVGDTPDHWWEDIEVTETTSLADVLFRRYPTDWGGTGSPPMLRSTNRNTARGVVPPREQHFYRFSFHRMGPNWVVGMVHSKHVDRTLVPDLWDLNLGSQHLRSRGGFAFGGFGGSFGFGGLGAFGGFGGSGFGGGFGGGGLGGGGFGGNWQAVRPGGNTGFGGGMHGFGGQGEMPPVLPGAGQLYLRRDFADSAYWNAGVRTQDGKATVSFKLPDSQTNWRVVVTAVGPDTHVGRTVTSFRSTQPIMIWPMLPRSYVEGDRIRVFGSVYNRTDKPQDMTARLKVTNGKVASEPEVKVRVGPMSHEPVYWTFEPGEAGFTELLMTVECDAGSDASLKKLPVVRPGVEQVVTAAGFVKGTAAITVPEGVDPKRANLEITVAPSLAADLTHSLDYLVQYPYGCVEQTMSRFLPTVKVAQILEKYAVDRPDIVKKVPEYVAAGVKRLLELQNDDGGWGWHGGSQTHEMMTPYALYGLLQAEKAGYPLPNEQAVTRGLKRLRQFIEQTTDTHTADRIYCMYVYAHRHDLEADWWAFIERNGADGKLSDYALALSLEMAVRKGKKPLADRLAESLSERATKTDSAVYWKTADFSRWDDDRFEITAAALKALTAYDPDHPLIPGVLSYFAATKQGDRWNSTKSTAMVIYAMCDYLLVKDVKANTAEAVKFRVNGDREGKIPFGGVLTESFVVPSPWLTEGENRVTFATELPGVMYRLRLSYWESGDKVTPGGEGVTVERTFHLLSEDGEKVRELKSGDTIPRGSYVLSEVRAKGELGEPMRYILVEDFKPSGAEYVPADDPRFAEVHGKENYAQRDERTAHVAFHHEWVPAAWEDRTVMRVELAGRYVVPPAKVEMMYRTETRGHSGSFVLNVAE